VGHGLLAALREAGRRNVVAMDLRPLDPHLVALARETYVGDIRDRTLLDRLESMFEVTEVYHLAALLSTRAEFTPETAHDVNVGGTLNLLRLAAEQARSHGKPVRFLFPSSIAVYGFHDPKIKEQVGAVAEDEHTWPTTMYGCNKLYCEHLGRYYANFYRQLARDRMEHVVDFRCLRYPGLISAETLPSGGTSDYAADMIHAAAQGKPYACFVRPDTRIPFMTMPDAIDALIALARVPAERLTRCIYNVRAFNPSAGELAELVGRHFPAAEVTFNPDPPRQTIVDSWPTDVDDSAARADWGFAPKHDLEKAFEAYLVPRIRAHYASPSPPRRRASDRAADREDPT
jgi:nucleoside-diphosphate-sugar epimerase